MNKTIIQILLVEDNPADVILLSEVLERDMLSEFKLTSVERLDTAMETLSQDPFDVILLDLGLPDSFGLQTFTRLHQAFPQIPMIVLSGQDDDALALQAVHMGAQDYLVKGPKDWGIAARSIRYAIERHSQQQALQESERRFSTAFHGSPAGQAILRLADQKILDANEAFCHLVGFTRDQILGYKVEELNFWVNLNDQKRMKGRWESAGRAHDHELEFRTPSGELRTMLASVEPIEVNGEPCIICTALDITERKRAEIELRLYGEIMANISEGINMVRASDLTIIFTNPRFDQMFGYDEGELIGKSVSILNAPSVMSPEKVAHVIESTLKESGVFYGETQNIKKTGETFWCYGSVCAFDHTKHGKVWLSVQADISKLKHTELQLRESEERFRSVVEYSPDIIFTVDRQMRVQYINRVPAGKTIESVIGTSTLDYVLPEHREIVATAIQHVFETGNSTSYEIQARGDNDTLTWYFTRLGIMQRGTTNEQVLLITEDITQRRQAQLELHRSNERFTQLAENVTDIFWVMDLVTPNNHYVSPPYKDIIGMELADVLKLPNGILDLLLPEDRPILSKAYEQEANGIPSDIQFRIRRPDGSIRWLHDKGSPVFDENGRVIRVVGIAQDITRRIETEIKLRESEEKYRQLSEELEKRVLERTAEVQDLYENAPTGYHSLDERGNFIAINETELKWLGYSREEMIGRPFTDFVTPESLQTFRDNFPEFKKRGWVHDLEFDLRGKDGSTFPILLNATAIKDAQGNFLLSRSTVMDITERKKAEIALLMSRDELRVAYSALEKASLAKDEFLANMSHELRTPLNSILGMAEILLDGFRGPLNEHQQKLVQTIDTSGRHLLSLINDILDLSKIESGNLEIHPEVISVDRVCQSSLAFLKEPAHKKKISLEFIPDPIVTMVLVDERRLKQILVNLLSNAVKFTPDNGRVTLRVQANIQQSQLDLSVSDTGIGISAADLKHLFLPFTQLDSSLTREQEGTGLGLSLVKRLVELHGGGISITSEVGHGSCFTVSLPWQPIDAAPESLLNFASDLTVEPQTGERATSFGTILLTEDIETNIMTTGDYLENLGYHMIYAHHGREALEKANEHSPDLILMDIQMPIMDGLEATRRLRLNPRFATTPIIAITALAMPGDRDRCIEAGATEYISKPVHLKYLASLIRELLSRKQ